MTSPAILLYLVLFLSGFAGLGYEMVWTRTFSAALGHEMVSVLAVTTAFFCGLGLGSWALDRSRGLLRQPGRAYAALEFTVGLWSLALSFILPITSRFASRMMPAETGSPGHWSIAFLFPFLVLLPATFAMGGTLPLMERLFSNFGKGSKHVGGLYGANTFGAMAGTLAATFWFIPELGLRNTQLLLGAVNIICAAGILLCPVSREESAFQATARTGESVASLFITVSLLTTGFLGIGYEVLAIRVLSQILENTVYSFSSILSVYLFGTALGAALYQSWSPGGNPRALLGRLAMGLSLACMAGTVVLVFAEHIYTAVQAWTNHGFIGALCGEICTSAAVFLLPTVLMGITFSHLAQGACEKNGGLGRALCVNTIGSALAPILFGLVFLPSLGQKTALILTALGYLLLVPVRGRRIPLALLSIPLGIAILIYFSPFSMQFVHTAKGERVVKYVEGVMAGISVVCDQDRQFHLKINNHYQMGGTSSAFSDRRQGQIPLLLHPGPKTALYLGLGTGATMAAALDHPGLKVEGVELIPEIISVLPFFTNSIGEMTSDPRVKITAADARRYVNTSPKSYDVIVADLFHPSRDGAGSLYTIEHFTAIRHHLAPGGLFCQWLPLYQLDLATLRTIIRTFLEVFPKGSAYLAHYSLKAPIIGLVGTTGSNIYPANWLAKRVKDAALAQRLGELRLQTDFNLFGCFLAGAEELKRFAGPGPLNTDDLPLVTYQAPRFVYSNEEPAYKRLFVLIDTFHPTPDQVFGPPRDPDGTDRRTRLAAYWTARNHFLRAGAGVSETDDLQHLLSRLRGPLLTIVRESSDFDAAYNPLLAIAGDLFNVDRNQCRSLLLDLKEANPCRQDARKMFDQLFTN
jgi:spermidine synthase